MKKINSLVLSTLIAALLIGCGGGGGSSAGTANSTATTTTGTFIDDRVSGVKYVNGSNTGFTDANGQFPYTSGVISFYIGNINFPPKFKSNYNANIIAQKQIKNQKGVALRPGRVD